MDASSNCRKQIVATFEWALNGLNLSSFVHFLEIESLVLSNVAFHDTKLCYLLVYLVSTGISFCSKKKRSFLVNFSSGPTFDFSIRTYRQLVLPTFFVFVLFILV